MRSEDQMGQQKIRGTKADWGLQPQPGMDAETPTACGELSFICCSAYCSFHNRKHRNAFKA